jgi:hypothetical protein
MFTMGRNVVSHVLQPLHIAIASLYAVVSVVVIFGIVRVAMLLSVPLMYVGRITRYNDFVRRSPILCLIGSVAPTAWFAAQGPLPFGPDPLHIVVGSIGWLFALYTVLISYLAAGENPADRSQWEATIASRWPDRWYFRHMKRPPNAIIVRFLVINSILMIPAAAAVIAPGALSVYSVFFFVLALLYTGLPHEIVDHEDLHSNIFEWRHLPRGISRSVLWSTSRYLRLILNPVCLRVPHFYRLQHVYIHHGENNGLGDIQSTLRFDRTSGFDFCRYALMMGLSWTAALDVHEYFRKKGNIRQCRLLMLGFALWFAALGLIALHNPAAAVFFLALRFMLGVNLALNIYFWHGLADPDDPENICLNTVNLVPVPGAPRKDLHVLHHEQSGVPFARRSDAQKEKEDFERWKNAGVLSLPVNMPPTLMTQALLAKRFDVIARFVVGREDMRQEELVTLIERRTRPLHEKKRTEIYRWLDRRFAMLMATWLLPGKLPPVAEASGRPR